MQLSRLKKPAPADFRHWKRPSRKGKKATEAAVAAAQSQASAEVENLKARAEKQRQQLRDKANTKMPSAAAKVMEYLGSHLAK